jgi:hypothetical protein
MAHACWLPTPSDVAVPRTEKLVLTALKSAVAVAVRV